MINGGLRLCKDGIPKRSRSKAKVDIFIARVILGIKPPQPQKYALAYHERRPVGAGHLEGNTFFGGVYPARSNAGMIP
jgi:hypothetical protein